MNTYEKKNHAQQTLEPRYLQRVMGFDDETLTSCEVGLKSTLAEIKGPGDASIRVSLWGKNLTDEGYWTSGVWINPLLALNLWGEPRTYGAGCEILFQAGAWFQRIQTPWRQVEFYRQ